MITILGLALVAAGLSLGLTPPVPFDGRWLLGGVVAFIGLCLLWRNRTGGPHDRQNGWK